MAKEKNITVHNVVGKWSMDLHVFTVVVVHSRLHVCLLVCLLVCLFMINAPCVENFVLLGKEKRTEQRRVGK